MPITFIKCTEAHLDNLVWISVKTFVDAFEADNNPKDFKTYISSAFSTNAIKAQLAAVHSSFYFVYLEKKLVGYFKLNEFEKQTEPRGTQTMELERIYVLHEFQGQRLGNRMVQKVIEIASEKGKTKLWLGVWEHNSRAINFYKKLGFKRFGTHPYYVGEDRQTDLLMELTNIHIK